MRNVIIIGAGQAGLACAARLRSVGFDGAITMIGSEAVPPYQRPPLSKKYLLGEMDIERIFLRPKQFYDDNSIRLLLNTRVDRIDVANRTVSASGAELPYDDLVLATGAVPRALSEPKGGTLDCVHSIRSLVDIDRLVPKIRAGARALIVGGGYIGLEAAAVCASKGMDVVLIEMADSILQRIACKETANYFRELHRRHGVEIREGVGLDLVGCNGCASTAHLTDGTKLDVDCVIVGIGVDPEVGLARDATLSINNGIHTNQYGQTSNENIWAAGDCASFPFNGMRVRLESVPNAIDQGEVVADNIMGVQKIYQAKPWFWSDQFDVKLQIAGLNSGYTRVVTRKGPKNSFSSWYYCGGKLLAVDAMNAPRDFNVGKRLLDASISPSPDEIRDPNQDIMDFLNVPVLAKS